MQHKRLGLVSPPARTRSAVMEWVCTLSPKSAAGDSGALKIIPDGRFGRVVALGAEVRIVRWVSAAAVSRDVGAKRSDALATLPGNVRSVLNSVI